MTPTQPSNLNKFLRAVLTVACVLTFLFGFFNANIPPKAPELLTRFASGALYAFMPFLGLLLLHVKRIV